MLSTGPGRADQWLTYGGNEAHSGANPTEQYLTPGNVSTMIVAWRNQFTGPLLGQPLIATAIPVPNGTGGTTPTDLVYAADLNGVVKAVNADTGATVWTRTVNTVPICNGDVNQYTVLTKLGVVATPTIDTANNRIFIVDAKGFLWALALDTGNVMTGYPVSVLPAPGAGGGALAFGGLTFDPLSGLTFDPLSGYLYVTSGGQCEDPNYVGQVVQVKVEGSSPVPPKVSRTFSTTPMSVGGGGIWGPGGASIDSNGYIYIAAGNSYDAAENTDYAEHVVKLDPTLTVIASSRPKLVSGQDLDFGATPLPFQPHGCPPLLAVENKGGQLFIYNTTGTDISTGPYQIIQIIQTAAFGGFIGIPVYDPISDQLFVSNRQDNTAPAGNVKFKHGLIALGVNANCKLKFNHVSVVGDNDTTGQPTVPPTFANGVAYYPDGNTGVVYAFDITGTQLWNSGKNITAYVETAVTVVNGALFVADYGGTLTAFAAP